MSYDPHSDKTTHQKLPRPFNGTIYTTIRQASAEKPAPLLGSSMSAELGPEFTNSLVIGSQKGPERAPSDQLVIRHAVIPTEAEQLLTNWEKTEVNVGGKTFDAIVRTVIMLASAYNPAEPAYNTAMPIASDNRFQNEGYILYESVCVDSGMELEPVFRVERRTYIKRYTYQQYTYDDFFGAALYEKNWVVHKAEAFFGVNPVTSLFDDPDNAAWGLQANGNFRGGFRLNDKWFLVTERNIVPEWFVTNGRTYASSQDYYWPPVLSSISIETWTRRDGGEERYFRPVYSKEGYRGECRASVTETFHVTAPAVAAPSVMKPMPINIQTPYFGVSVGPTLHGLFNLVFTNGTEDPEFVYTAAEYSFPATSPTDWPASVVIENVRPFRGGFLKSVMTIYPPA